MNVDQYNRLMDTLGEIIERMPEKPDKRATPSYALVTNHRFDAHRKGVPCQVILHGLNPADACGRDEIDHSTSAWDEAVHHGAGPVAPGPLRKVAQSQALYNVLLALDSWIEGARENHDAMEHRGESSGGECWRTFTPADIRRMVNDTARELGLTEFPLSTIAKEDQV